MDNTDLTILIPARNEEFLGRTIQDILENIEGNTEIIAILDGYLPNPPLPKSDRVTVIYNPVSVGQRAGTNQAAKIARGKYLMKCDAHVAFDKGFDVKMLEAFKETGDNVTMIPVMRNLHVFDWVCENGHRRYQSPSGVCETCGKPTKKDIVWFPKPSPATHSFRFDKTMHFQYHSEHSKNKETQKGLLIGYKLSFDTRSISPSIIDFLTGLASSHKLVCFTNNSWFRQNVSSNTMCFSSIDDGRSVGADEVDSIRDKFEMSGITAQSVFAQMVNNGDILSPTSGNFSNQPSIGETMCECFVLEDSASTITTYVSSSSPIPTATNIINSDIAKKFSNVFGRDFIYNEKTNSFHNESVTLLPVYSKDIRETMSIQGSCFMLTKEKYFELDICSEEFHSWGQQGVEVACKTWLSGGRVIVNMRTWFAHMFRTRGGDFGFPYSNPQDKVNENREYSRELFQKDKWPKATRKFQWLIDKFNPPEWGLTKGIIYYTHNELDEKIAKPVRDRLQKISDEKKIPIVSSSLKKMDFGVKNIRFPTMKKNFLTMFKQILAALEHSKSDIIFFCEHDVLYHPSHFDFTPEREDTFYYNQNVWMLRMPDGHALHYDVNQLSGLCVYRDAALTHFRERFKMAEEAAKTMDDQEFNGWVRHMGFEPMTHGRVDWKNKFHCETWKSEAPNVDIKHGANATGQRWKKEQYRNQQLLVNWIESDTDIPSWGRTADIVASL